MKLSTLNPKKYDRVYIGFITGMLIPVITFVITWAVMSDLGFIEYLKRFYNYNKLPSLISLSVIPNLLIFFIFIWTNRNFSARGVLSATFLMTIIMIIVKLL